LIDILVNNVWISVGIWALLYIGDYAFTIIGAKLYQGGANRYYTFEMGYELNPVFQKDIAKLRYFSPRFVLFLITTSILILIIWRLSRPFPQLFIFLIGALILAEVSIHTRHMRNIALFRFVKQEGAVGGHISYSRWLSYRVSALEIFSFAVLYLIIYFLTERIFFLGGVATCSITGIKHLFLSRKAVRQKLAQRDVAGAEGSKESGLDAEEEH
jgi:hypothetical protein